MIAFGLGAIVGSFLNVCIVRIPYGESIVFPSSHCLSCRRPIAWYDNIPLASFFILKGRCRNCGARVSWQYPLVELSAALLFVLFYSAFGLTVTGVLYLLLALGLLTQALIDWKHQIIPDGITLPGIVIGLAASAFFPGLQGQPGWLGGALFSLLGILLGGGVLYAAGTIAEWVLKKEAMGGGDVKLLAMIGAFTGWQGVLWTLFVASFVGSAVGIYFRVTRGEEKLPFGPYLAVAAFLYLFFGQGFFDWYRQMIGWG